MPRSAKKSKPSIAPNKKRVTKCPSKRAIDPSQLAVAAGAADKERAVSKQSQLLAMLQSSSGTTIAAMMEATGWQQHSVRGFLAGVVRKRLKLKLGSTKVDGVRVYRIASRDGGKPGRKSRRSSA
jgi:hypothetical protein